MIPVWLKGDSKYTSFMCRKADLALPSVSTNNIFNYISSHIANASTVGIKRVYPFGVDIHIFINVIGFVAEYTAVFFEVDVESHSAATPCPLCPFTENTDILGSTYRHITIIASKRKSNVLFAQRSEEVRKSRCLIRTEANRFQRK